MNEQPPTEAVIAVDRGSPDGDFTALSVKCICGRLYTMTVDPAVSIEITRLDCRCGYSAAVSPLLRSSAGAGTKRPVLLDKIRARMPFVDHRALDCDTPEPRTYITLGELDELRASFSGEPSARCAVCDHLEELHAPFNLQHAFVAKSPAEPSVEPVKGSKVWHEIQGLRGMNARRSIEMRIIEDLLNGISDDDLTSLDMEYWLPVHDRIRALVRKSSGEPGGDVDDLRIAAIHLMREVEQVGHDDYGPECHICRAIQTVKRFTTTKEVAQGEKGDKHGG